MSERVEVATSNCRDCGAPVIWAAYTKKDGTPTKMPFDKDPVENAIEWVFCLLLSSFYLLTAVAWRMTGFRLAVTNPGAAPGG